LPTPSGSYGPVCVRNKFLPENDNPIPGASHPTAYPDAPTGPVFYNSYATGGDGNYTLPAASPMLPQPVGSIAISLDNPQSDPTTGSDSSSGTRFYIHPLVNQLITQARVPRINSDFVFQPPTFNLSWARMRKEKGSEALYNTRIRSEAMLYTSD
jgi:hypothetical protein